MGLGSDTSSTPLSRSGSLYTNSPASSPIGVGAKNGTSAPTTTLSAAGSTGASQQTSNTPTFDPVSASDNTYTSSAPESTPADASTSSVSTISDLAPTANLGTNQTSSALNSRNALPGRTFYDSDGKTVKDPIETLADAGINAIRVETFRGDCLGPEPSKTTASPLDDEDDFELDFGCVNVKVKIAKQAIALRMRMQLTINQGPNIPKGVEKFSYGEMLQEVQKEAKRQLQPFLDANIVPEIILLQNEVTDDFLFHEEATGHNRAQNDGKVNEDVVNQEKCGQIPTGKMDSYPQLAGYYKAEVIACNEAIKTAGRPVDTVRYGLHSHGQYVQWKESAVHGPKQAS
ncbi:MAG: hypothetical protein Q9166_001224 [cf. Caloplaca sp. 2 TL-2023]